MCLSSDLLSRIVQPLLAKFGDDLTLHRDGDAVRWDYAGQSTVIELRPGGRLHATFLDLVGIDVVSRRPTAAAYTARSSYSLNLTGCAHMVTDMVDFFSGVREPAFRFVDAFPR